LQEAESISASFFVLLREINRVSMKQSIAAFFLMIQTKATLTEKSREGG